MSNVKTATHPRTSDTAVASRDETEWERESREHAAAVNAVAAAIDAAQLPGWRAGHGEMTYVYGRHEADIDRICGGFADLMERFGITGFTEPGSGDYTPEFGFILQLVDHVLWFALTDVSAGVFGRRLRSYS